MKKNILYLPLLVLMVSGCSSEMYQLDKDTLSLHSKKEQMKIIDIPLQKDKLHYNHLDSCVLDSFVIKDSYEKYGKLYIESVDLDNDCSWTGSANGYWEQLFRDKEKIKSSGLVDRFDVGHYEFSQHLVNDTYKVNFIYLWGVSESLIIIDTKGILTQELLVKLHSQKKLPIEKNEIFSIQGDYSLVEENWIKKYFKKDGSSSLSLDSGD